MADNLTLQYEMKIIGGVISWTPASANGHQFPNAGDVGIWIDNQNASPVTITVVTARECEFGVFPNKEIEIAGNAVTKLPTFNPRRFTDVGTGLLVFTLSQAAGVNVAAVVQQQYFKET